MRRTKLLTQSPQGAREPVWSLATILLRSYHNPRMWWGYYGLLVFIKLGGRAVYLLSVGLFSSLANLWWAAPSLSADLDVTHSLSRAHREHAVNTLHLHAHPEDAHSGCFQFFEFVLLWFRPSQTGLEKQPFISSFTRYCFYFYRRGSHSGIVGTKGMWITFFLADIARLLSQKVVAIRIFTRQVGSISPSVFTSMDLPV